MFASIPECFMEYRKIKIEAQSLFVDFCQLNFINFLVRWLDEVVVCQ